MTLQKNPSIAIENDDSTILATVLSDPQDKSSIAIENDDSSITVTVSNDP